MAAGSRGGQRTARGGQPLRAAGDHARARGELARASQKARLLSHLGAAKVAQAALERRWVAEQVVRLDVAVADAACVNVLQRAKRLAQVGLDVIDVEAACALVVLQCDGADRLWKIVHHQVQERLILLAPGLFEVVPQAHHILVLHHLHHLQLAIVVPPVEHHLFDGDDLAVLAACSPDDAKGAVAHHLLQVVAMTASIPHGALLDTLGQVLDLVRRAGCTPTRPCQHWFHRGGRAKVLRRRRQVAAYARARRCTSACVQSEI